MNRIHLAPLAAILGLLCLASASPKLQAAEKFQTADVFRLEWASDPQISPDGKRIAYLRNYMDIMQDHRSSSIWLINSDGSAHAPLTDRVQPCVSPRWFPDGDRLLCIRGKEIHVLKPGNAQSLQVITLDGPPSGPAISPDGKQIAVSVRIPKHVEPFVTLPSPPPGASWAEPVRAIEHMVYRADSVGYLSEGYEQILVASLEDGSVRQITHGEYRHVTPTWAPDGRSLYLVSQLKPDWQLDPTDTEIYAVSAEGGELSPLTDRKGPDHTPLVSPDGKWIAYLGYDDVGHGYNVAQLYLMRLDGSHKRSLTPDLDRDVMTPAWRADSRGLYFRYDDFGDAKVAYINLDGELQMLADHIGGTIIGRPYGSGSFSVANDGTIAYTLGATSHPADVAIATRKGSRRLTHLNDDLFAGKALGEVEELSFKSSYDSRSIQAWLVTPPNFDPRQRYPLTLEIHGGPWLNYGPRFSAEMQLYAASGYVVLYVNYRGSSSYGEEFGNLVHNNLPGEAYDDLMSGVDAVIGRPYIDTDNLFVTGGSMGGMYTAWTVGKTNRFAAAVAAKPIINWRSFLLTADRYEWFHKQVFAQAPWEDPLSYFERSPISLVGNVTTPTMLIAGEEDYRTRISEAEQFYQALKLRGVDAMLVRVPGASHQISNRPSQLIARVAYTIAWFERYRR